jgi:uncharacterized repeat protein (TIGR04138 family)
MRPPLREIIEQIVREDGRYPDRAYHFVLMALQRVIRSLPKPRHISGAELSEGCRDLAIAEYGPLARTVLQYWGITTTEDFGELIFNLLDRGILIKTNADSKKDFIGVFDFDEAFKETFPSEKSSEKSGEERDDSTPPPVPPAPR